MNGVFTTHFEKKILPVGGGVLHPIYSCCYKVGGLDRKAHSFRFFGQLTPRWGPTMPCWSCVELSRRGLYELPSYIRDLFSKDPGKLNQSRFLTLHVQPLGLCCWTLLEICQPDIKVTSHIPQKPFGWWFQPLWKISQNGNLPQVWMKIKNIWNHQPALDLLGVFGWDSTPLGRVQGICIAKATHKSSATERLATSLPDGLGSIPGITPGGDGNQKSQGQQTRWRYKTRRK